MQDNRSQKEKDGTFEDKAWMDMRKLLDKEMPVRKKDRAFLWWWGSAGILLLLVMVGSLFIFFNKKQARTLNEKNGAVVKESSIITKKEKPIVPSNKEELSINTQTKEQQIVSIDKNQFPANEETKSLKIIERSDTPNNTEIRKESINKIQKETARTKVLDNRIYPNVIIADDNLNLQNSIINPRKALEEITYSSADSPTFIKEEKVLLRKKKEHLALANLPILELIDLPIASYEPTFPVYAMPKKNRIEWGLVASLGTFKLTRFNEYAVGLKTTYQWNPNWKVGTGLNYHYFRLNGLVKNDDNIKAFDAPDIIRTMEPTIDAAAGTSDTNEEADMDTLPTTPVEQVFVDPLALAGNGHYLSIPLFVEYQVSSRLKLDVGAAYYYKLTTSYDSVENRIKSSDWTVFMGVGYELTPFVDLRLGYERNWSNRRSKSVNIDFQNASTLGDLFTDKVTISPIESRLKISGIWRF